MVDLRQAHRALRGCTKHGEEPAGWRCPGCDRDLCRLCAARGPGDIAVCATCGGLTEVLLVPRALVLPFARTWRTAAAQLVTLAGLTQVLVVATALQLLFGLPPRLWFLGRALELAWILFLARRVGVGFGAFGRPRYRDLWSVWVGPVPRALAGTFPVLVGALALSAGGTAAAPLASPWTWLLVGATTLTLPPTLVVASVEGAGRSVPWPWHLRRWTAHLGADDLRPLTLAVLVGAVAEALAAFQAPFDGEDLHLDLHILQAFLPHLVSLGALGLAGCLAGHLVFTRASELGHDAGGSDLVPRLAEPPQGLYLPSPVEVAAAAEARARRFAPLELEDPESRLARALDAGQGQAALELLDGGARVAGLQTSQRVVLAQLLAGRGEAARAADLLRLTLRAGEVRDPRAVVVLARLCAERLGARDEALGLYREVAAAAPDSPAGAYARGQLEALAGPLVEPETGE